MAQISNLVFLLSAVSLASLVTCRPAAEDSFDLIQEEGNLPQLDYPLFPADRAMEESPQLPDSGLEIIDPLSTTSFSGPTSTTFALDSDLNPSSPLFALADSSPSFPPSSFPFQIADGTLCPGGNRFAFCCKGEKCVKTAKCYTDEDLNCCTVDPRDDVDKTPYDCQPPSAPSVESVPNIQKSSSIFLGQLPSEHDSAFSENFFGEFPDDSSNSIF